MKRHSKGLEHELREIRNGCTVDTIGISNDIDKITTSIDSIVSVINGYSKPVEEIQVNVSKDRPLLFENNSEIEIRHIESYRNMKVKVNDVIRWARFSLLVDKPAFKMDNFLGYNNIVKGVSENGFGFDLVLLIEKNKTLNDIIDIESIRFMLAEDMPGNHAYFRDF